MIASKLRGWQQMNDRDRGQAKERVPPHQRVTSKLPTLRERDRAGFWESAGYHIRGDPWKEERYS
jgi:DMSO/TMAO reductase YedYZ molybdopterin-dependent catalytic subunit